MKTRFVEYMVLVMILLQQFRGLNRELSVHTWRMKDARVIHRELYLGSGHCLFDREEVEMCDYGANNNSISVRLGPTVEKYLAERRRDVERCRSKSKRRRKETEART